MSHTPAPWLHDVMISGRFMIREPGVLDHAIAEVDNVANARLIRAAPDLLSACRAALSIAWETGTESEDGVQTLLDDGRGDLYRTLSAAIEKATS